MKNIQTFEEFNESDKWIQRAIKHPGALRRSLKKKKGDKISKSEINQEIAKLKERDQDEDKPGLQLDERDRKKYKRLTLARTLKDMH